MNECPPHRLRIHARRLLLSLPVLVTACTFDPSGLASRAGSGADPLQPGADAGAPSGDAERGWCDTAGAGAILCADFEAPLPGPFQDQRLDDGEIDRSDMAHGGREGLRTRAAPGGHARLEWHSPWPITDGQLFARMHFFVPEAEEPESWIVLLSLLSAEQDGKDKISVDIHQQDRLGLVVNTAGKGKSSDDRRLPRGRWVCAELQVDIDDDDGRAVLQVEDERIEIDGHDTLAGEGFEWIKLGVANSSDNHETAVVHFDDLLITRDDRPAVHCP